MELSNSVNPETNNSGAPISSFSYNLQAATNPAQTIKIAQPNVSPAMAYQMAFPEIYYKLQPYIMMVCDQMEPINSMPTQDMMDNISDSIFDDMCKRYPDLAEYAHSQEENASANPIIQTATFGGTQFGWRFRRRGLFRDLIDILLLSELFGRRRRYYY